MRYKEVKKSDEIDNAPESQIRPLFKYLQHVEIKTSLTEKKEEKSFQVS